MTGSGWLDADELRVGLGCMRLSRAEDRDEERAAATIAAAADAGITVFDTARSYARDESELGHNERLLARSLRACGGARRARVVTKGGMARDGGRWAPDGRARTIRADCEASLVDLDGLAVDLYLLHAPDPRTSWRTSLRALSRLIDDGLVRRVGVSNVNLPQLEEALDLTPLAAVQVAVSPFDESALRGGVVKRCVEAGIALIAHSPLGGPRRANGLARRDPYRTIAERQEASAAEIALAWLLDLAPNVIAIPGARRPETARSAARAARIELDDEDRARLPSRRGDTPPSQRRSTRQREGSEVVLVMGIPGAGKSKVAEEYVARGYRRFNRDERGGTLRELAGELGDALSSGLRKAVLDNTYLTRASRSYVLEAASASSTPVRCLWLDTALDQAQVNLVERLLDRFGSLPEPDELKRLTRSEPGVLTPTSQMRAVHELEPPAADEGFSAVDRVVFERAASSREAGSGVLVAAGALRHPRWEDGLAGADPASPHLVFEWSGRGEPEDLGALVAELDSRVTGTVETALCAHGGGPPRCWCRPPLPGLALAFARAHGVDLSRSLVVGTGTAHRALAAALGARYAER